MGAVPSGGALSTPFFEPGNRMESAHGSQRESQRLSTLNSQRQIKVVSGQFRIHHSTVGKARINPRMPIFKICKGPLPQKPKKQAGKISPAAKKLAVSLSQ